MNIAVITEHPIAIDSNDHIHPWGTKNDNNSNRLFNDNIYSLFPGQAIKIMDLGCAGGKMIKDFIDDGHFGIGLEGSDYCRQHGLFEWPIIPDNLFTCDISYPFDILDDGGERILFDVITAWDVLEHMFPERLDVVFQNIVKHLSQGSYFVGSIPSGGNKEKQTGSYGDPLWHHTHLTNQEWIMFFEKYGLRIQKITSWIPEGWVRGYIPNRAQLYPDDTCLLEIFKKQ